jgi:multidrug efflux pump subunit AcrA (membrane-fusion protein)
MTARVTYNVASDGAIRLPSHAAFSDPEGAPHVWLVDPATMKVKRQPVKLGGLVGGEVEIVQGLEAGNQVAISGVSQLREGMQVRRYQPRTDTGQG